MRTVIVFASALLIFAATGNAETPAQYLHPRPSGFAEDGAPPTKQNVSFQPVSQFVNVVFDTVAEFPKNSAPPFHVDRVSVNGEEQPEFVVANRGVFNGHRWVYGSEDFSVSLYSKWEPGKSYAIAVEGVGENGEPVRLAANEQAPADRTAIKGTSFAGPTAEFPYHRMTITLAKEVVEPGTVVSVEVDGKKNRDARIFNTGMALPDAVAGGGIEGESYKGVVTGARDVQIVAPVNWLNGSDHAMRVVMKTDAGPEKTYKAKGTAPDSGGYWNADWPHATSIVLHETVGLLRQAEPVHLALGLFADDITKPENEIRVVTYDPTSPKAGPDGYVVAPSQVTNVTIWRDERLLNSDERDAETGEPVHRYDATTTVELVFFADVQPYAEKVYQVVYGNPKAEPLKLDADLRVVKGEGLSQTITNSDFEIYLSKNSGAVETIKILKGGDPVLLEHKLETNGAVHWNPGIYSPPTPWVHVSDWESPIYDEISGPLMHRTRRYSQFPHMDSAVASISYEFYAGTPYVLMSSYMEVQKDMFVQALRNAEIVFNHAVLNEFIWMDPLGKVQSLDILTAREHPIHALEIPPDTPWMAFINREKRVGFANIELAYDNGNRFGQPPSEAQPYIYVQNGPWIYWSRPIVYPFGGANFTRMMPVRAGSFSVERNAWVPFRFADGDNPWADLENLQKQLTHPLKVHEWMATDDRTPEAWVMPILTMPFNEGVAGALSGHKEVKDDDAKEGNKK